MEIVNKILTPRIQIFKIRTICCISRLIRSAANFPVKARPKDKSGKMRYMSQYWNELHEMAKFAN